MAVVLFDKAVEQSVERHVDYAAVESPRVDDHDNHRMRWQTMAAGSEDTASKILADPRIAQLFLGGGLAQPELRSGA